MGQALTVSRNVRGLTGQGWGDGANNDAWQHHNSTEIDPDEPGRTSNLNYKLMISSTVPRPIAHLSTVSGLGIQNMAPFSYFQAICADPPLYSFSFVGDQPMTVFVTFWRHRMPALASSAIPLLRQPM